MHSIAADMVSQGVRAYVQRFTAGDVLTFDGRWWHATNYTAPVLNMCAVLSFHLFTSEETLQVFDLWQRWRGQQKFFFTSRAQFTCH